MIHFSVGLPTILLAVFRWFPQCLQAKNRVNSFKHVMTLFLQTLGHNS